MTMTQQRVASRCTLLAAVSMALACDNAASPHEFPTPDLQYAKVVATGPQVTSTNPSDAPRDTTLDVHVIGSGFDKGSQVSFGLDGVQDSRVRVNQTRYVKSTTLIANVTIAVDALADRYDVIVVTATGKKGIGTEKFEVTLRPEVLAGGIHAQSVNSAGDAVGWGQSSASCSGPYVSYFWPANGTTQTLPTGTYCGSTSKEINEGGVVLGALSGGPANASVLWFPGAGGYTFYEIPPAPNGYRPIAAGLNDANEVIGWGQNGAQVFWWSQATGWLSVPVPAGSTQCQVWKGINNSGEIVGRCTIGGVQYPYYWPSPTSPPSRLPLPVNAPDAIAIDINSQGTIIGRSSAGAIRWVRSGGAYTFAEVLPDAGYGGHASAIAEDGSISGSVAAKGNGYARPVYWLPGGGYRLLGMRNYASWGDAPGIASTSQGLVVVGSERNAQSLRWKSSQ